MPSGKRYRLTLKGVKYDFSPEQFKMLARRVIPLKFAVEWNSQQRLYGLVNKSLFVKKEGKYRRTNIGTEVYKALIA